MDENRRSITFTCFIVPTMIVVRNGDQIGRAASATYNVARSDLSNMVHMMRTMARQMI